MSTDELRRAAVRVQVDQIIEAARRRTEPPAREDLRAELALFVRRYEGGGAYRSDTEIDALIDDALRDDE